MSTTARTTASDATLSALADKYDTARDAYLAAMKKEKELRAIQERVERELWDAMVECNEREGTDNKSFTRASDGVRFTMMRKRYPQITDSDALMRATKELGKDTEWLRQEFRRSALTEYVNECLETGQALPEGLDYYYDESISRVGGSWRGPQTHTYYDESTGGSQRGPQGAE